MTDTVKRGPGRPKATAAATDTSTGTVAVLNTDTDVLVYAGEPVEVALYTDPPKLEPVIDRKLTQTPHGTLRWVNPESNYLSDAVLAYGWSDGLVTWGETRG